MSTNEKNDRRFTPKQIFRWLWLLISAVFVFWVLVFELDWREVTSALAQANYVWVAISILITIVAIFMRTWRWQALLQTNTRTFAIMTALLVGQAVNLVLPLRSGDLMRVLLYRETKGSGGAEALGTVAIEKVWDLFVLFLCTVLLLILIPLPESILRTVWGTSGLLVVGIIGLLLGLKWQDSILDICVKITMKFPPRLRVLILPRIAQLIRGLDVIRQSRVSSQALIWTVGVWATGIMANWAVMAAFGVRSTSAAILLMVTLMSGAVIVPIPGRLGIFEAIVIGSLSLYDVPSDTALAIGLVLHGVAMGTPMIAALILSIITSFRKQVLTTPL